MPTLIAILLKFIKNPITLICIPVFCLAWYDTTHSHIFTFSLNTWVIETLHVSPAVTDKWHRLYNEILLFLTGLASTGSWVVMMLMVYAGLAYKKQYKLIIYCTFFAVFAAGIVFLLKQNIYSPRPLFPIQHDSFSSGHAIRISIICGILWWLNQLRIFSFPKYTNVVLLLLPILIGYSRVVLGYHWLSDVVASYCIALVTLNLTRICYSEIT